MREKKLDFLIEYLLREYKDEGRAIDIRHLDKRSQLRALMNIREPKSISNEFLKIQDEVLSDEVLQKGIVKIEDIEKVSERSSKLMLWQGDITRLRVDAIVNAANSQLLGCFSPLHNCIDNAIHSVAGVQLREECNEIMQKQTHLEEVGQAKITKAYNLPAQYVLHTVGPIISSSVADRDREQLKSCYNSCLALAEEKQLKSIAFCCISTGVFRFPNDEAAYIAVNTVRDYFLNNPESSIQKVIFNVFKDIDLKIYEKLL